MLRSLLVGLLALAIPFTSLADPTRGASRERGSAPPRSPHRPETHGSAHGRGPKPRAHLTLDRTFRNPRLPSRRGGHDADGPPWLPGVRRECREVSEPPQIALFLLGVGGLALLGRRRQRRSDLAPGSQRSREIT